VLGEEREEERAAEEREEEREEVLAEEREEERAEEEQAEEREEERAEEERAEEELREQAEEEIVRGEEEEAREEAQEEALEQIREEPPPELEVQDAGGAPLLVPPEPELTSKQRFALMQARFSRNTESLPTPEGQNVRGLFQGGEDGHYFD
jgi:hypothetical protein